MKKYYLLAFLLVASVCLALTPVTPNSGYRPAGTVIKKVVGSDTFAYDEMPAGGGSPAGATSRTTTNLTLVANVPQTVTTSASAVDFFAANNGTVTVWTGFAGVASISQGIPIIAGGYLAFDCGPGVTVTFLASSASSIGLSEGRR